MREDWIDSTEGDTYYQLPPLSSAQKICRFIGQNASLNGSKKASCAMRYVQNNSESPRETKLAILFGFPMHRGGYGLGMPKMNHSVKVKHAAEKSSDRKTFRCDLCWPDKRIDVEYQSMQEHAGGERLARDSLRANALASMGYKVINVTGAELASFAATDAIAHAIALASGKRIRERMPDYRLRQMELRRQLDLPA